MNSRIAFAALIIVLALVLGLAWHPVAFALLVLLLLLFFV